MSDGVAVCTDSNNSSLSLSGIVPGTESSGKLADTKFLGDRFQNGSPYLIGPLSCPVRDVGVLWPNGWIKMKLKVEVGLGPGHCVR